MEESVSSFIYYWIEGEFSINGKSYKDFYSDQSGEKTLQGYVRGENQKVYYWDGTAESVKYDFTLKKHDRFDEQEVLGIGYFPIGGQPHKYIDFVYSDGLYWVEGVGDLNALPFATFNPFPACDCGESLFYIKENRKLIHHKAMHHWEEGNLDAPIVDPFLGETGISEVKEFSLQIIRGDEG